MLASEVRQKNSIGVQLFTMQCLPQTGRAYNMAAARRACARAGRGLVTEGESNIAGREEGESIRDDRPTLAQCFSCGNRLHDERWTRGSAERRRGPTSRGAARRELAAQMALESDYRRRVKLKRAFRFFAVICVTRKEFFTFHVWLCIKDTSIAISFVLISVRVCEEK